MQNCGSRFRSGTISPFGNEFFMVVKMYILVYNLKCEMVTYSKLKIMQTKLMLTVVDPSTRLLVVNLLLLLNYTCPQGPPIKDVRKKVVIGVY